VELALPWGQEDYLLGSPGLVLPFGFPQQDQQLWIHSILPEQPRLAQQRVVQANIRSL
jgi:hypothetical protein